MHHEVLPCFSRRFAVTCWASSTSPVDIRIPLPLICKSKLGSEYNCRKIFVSIANYRDSEAPHSVNDLFAKASHPENIFIGIVNQVEEEDILAVVKTSLNIRAITISSDHATGPCLARHMAQALWRGEEFLLQIDSHMRFRQSK